MHINLNLPDNFLEEEIRDGHFVSKEMKKLWAVELDLLNEFIRVCTKYNLKYFVGGGTLLGTIRHKGFIPWDDDIDIAMPREDYDTLCNIAKKEFNDPYFFQTEYTDRGYCKGFAKLRNSSTTAIEKLDYNRNAYFNQGIFIDIFPQDSVPDDIKCRKKYLKKIIKKRHRSLFYNDFTIRFIKQKGFKGFIKNTIHRVLTIMDYCLKHKNIFYIQYEKYGQKYNKKPNANSVVSVECFNSLNRMIRKKEYFEDALDMNFEMLKVRVPKDYEKVLDSAYKNWRVPLKLPSDHNLTIIDTEKSYKEYLKK